GIANVYVDGVKSTVDTYASPGQAQVKSFSVGGLTLASHQLVIEVTGDRNTLSGGAWVWVDAFDVGASTSGGTGTTSPPATTLARIEEDNPAVAYSGQWFSNNLALHSNSRAALAMDKNASAMLVFTGTAVSWVGYRDESCGTARVYLDGSLVATV